MFTWPVKGEIIGAFSVETLAYDATMGDWRTHDGLDIAAGVGDQVLAAGSGTVREVVYDQFLGETVTIEHPDGVLTTYSNLTSRPVVAEGDVVSTGDVLGSIGTTATVETHLPSHLHFTMTVDGSPVDPEDYLVKR